MAKLIGSKCSPFVTKEFSFDPMLQLTAYGSTSGWLCLWFRIWFIMQMRWLSMRMWRIRVFTVDYLIVSCRFAFNNVFLYRGLTLLWLWEACNCRGSFATVVLPYMHWIRCTVPLILVISIKVKKLHLNWTKQRLHWLALQNRHCFTAVGNSCVRIHLLDWCQSKCGAAGSFQNGQEQLLNFDCTTTQEHIYYIELIIQVGAIPLLPFSLSCWQTSLLIESLFLCVATFHSIKA